MQQVLEKTSSRISFLNAAHQFLYIGIDVHKDQHTAVGLNSFGQILWKAEIDNTEENFSWLVKQTSKLSEEKGLKLVFGIEDTHQYGARLAFYLYQQNLIVKTVSPIFVCQIRQYETHPEKSDFLDALGVAKTLIQRIGSLPNYTISETDKIAKEIKESVTDREFLVKEQTSIKNQLHQLLHKAHNSKYREKFKYPFTKKALRYWHRCPVPRTNNDVLVDCSLLKKRVRRKVKRLLAIQKEIKGVEKELRELVDMTGQKIETLNGCGLVSAASLLAEIKNIERFASPSALAKYGGLCPRERSSGKKKKYIKTKSGNRRLNKAIHMIALAQIGHSGNEISKSYFTKKVSEGKSKAQALCCLKRRLINIVFMMMKYKQEYRYMV